MKNDRYTAGRGRQVSTASSSEAARRELEKWMRSVRFKRRLFGGIDEADVCKKLQELNALYEQALACERARYETLLEQAVGSGMKHE